MGLLPFDPDVLVPAAFLPPRDGGCFGRSQQPDCTGARWRKQREPQHEAITPRQFHCRVSSPHAHARSVGVLPGSLLPPCLSWRRAGAQSCCRTRSLSTSCESMHPSPSTTSRGCSRAACAPTSRRPARPPAHTHTCNSPLADPTNNSSSAALRARAPSLHPATESR